MIELHNVSYAYAGQETPAVNNVSLRIGKGEHLALVGPNGSGKSTLVRLMNGGLLATSGSITVDGYDPALSLKARKEIAKLVGFVRQDPTDQLVASRVFDEVAFGPCNLGLPADEVVARVKAALRASGLEGYDSRLCEELSGGEQQRLAIAGVLAMDPAYIVLDEVTSFLDSAARREVNNVIGALSKSSHTVVSVTHEMADLVHVDRVVLIEKGQATWEGSVSQLLSEEDLLSRSGLADDVLACLLAPLAACGFDPARALDPGAATDFAHEHGLSEHLSIKTRPGGSRASGGLAAADATLTMDNVHLSYGNVHALDACCLELTTGTITLLAGQSGSGKTSALRVLSGVEVPDAGCACICGKQVCPGQVGFSFQRPEEQLFCTTVSDEIAFGPKNLGVEGNALNRLVDEMLDTFDIREIADRSPLTLSGGQARRVSLACVVAMKTAAYVFDEPTAGLDGVGRAYLRSLVCRLAEEGAAVCVVSHDIADWISHVDVVLLMRQGRIVWRGSPQDLMNSLGSHGHENVQADPFSLAGMEVPPALHIAASCAQGRRPRA